MLNGLEHTHIYFVDFLADLMAIQSMEAEVQNSISFRVRALKQFDTDGLSTCLTNIRREGSRRSDMPCAELVHSTCLNLMRVQEILSTEVWCPGRGLCDYLSGATAQHDTGPYFFRVLNVVCRYLLRLLDLGFSIARSIHPQITPSPPSKKIGKVGFSQVDPVLERQKIYALERAGTMIKIVCLLEANSDLSPTSSMTKIYPN